LSGRNNNLIQLELRVLRSCEIRNNFPKDHLFIDNLPDNIECFSWICVDEVFFRRIESLLGFYDFVHNLEAVDCFFLLLRSFDSKDVFVEIDEGQIGDFIIF
jgi:hypothetical protein